MKEAKARRDAIGGELAAGRDPGALLRAMVSTAQPKLTIATWSEKFISSRIDLDKNTTRNYKTALKKVGETFGHRDPVTITVDEVAGWVATLAETMKPGTIQLYLLTFRMLIDYIGLDVNVARDPRVKLPKRVREEPTPPPAEHVLAILNEIHDPHHVHHHGARCAPARRGRSPALGRRRSCRSPASVAEVRDQA
jgi:hypothetical protein